MFPRFFQLRTHSHKVRLQERGFTLIELLIVMAIIAILASIVFGLISGAYERARVSRVKAETSQIKKAAEQYIIESGGVLPPDEDRGIPPGIEKYLAPGTWPTAPWPGSVYDWDVYPDPVTGPTYQISIRFCPLGLPAECKFPDEPWAKDFDYYSSVYLCIRGSCQAHPNQPPDHPGYCLNCNGESGSN